MGAPLVVLVLAAASRVVLGQTPHHRSQSPGGLHPGGKTCLGFTVLPRDTPYGFTALKDSRLLDVVHQATHIGDKGHTPVPSLITPIKKPAGHELRDTEKEFNKKINTIRYLIEQIHCVIEDLAYIFHADYHHPIATFATTIKAVLGIIFTYTP